MAIELLLEMHDCTQKIMMRAEFGITQYIPEYNCQYKCDGRKDIDSGRCKCCRSVFHSEVVQVLIQHWSVNPSLIYRLIREILEYIKGT